MNQPRSQAQCIGARAAPSACIASIIFFISLFMTGVVGDQEVWHKQLSVTSISGRSQQNCGGKLCVAACACDLFFILSSYCEYMPSVRGGGGLRVWHVRQPPCAAQPSPIQFWRLHGHALQLTTPPHTRACKHHTHTHACAHAHTHTRVHLLRQLRPVDGQRIGAKFTTEKIEDNNLYEWSGLHHVGSFAPTGKVMLRVELMVGLCSFPHFFARGRH
jgi:hypothetical protein